jgi:hypothetical protein
MKARLAALAAAMTVTVLSAATMAADFVVDTKNVHA